MEFLKTAKHRSLLSEILYIALNVGFVIGLMLIVRTTGSVWLAFTLILLSKWRVLSVRPRFWFANIQADLVSFIVGISFVIFLYHSNPTVLNISDFQSFAVQGVLSLLYIYWLLSVRPQSKRKYIVMQASIALFVGTISIFSISYGWVASPVILLMWLVGYATARHILSSYDEENHVLLLSIAWGFVVAEVSWLSYHWAVAYKLPIITNLLLPQVAIVMLCLGFVVYKSYDSFYHHQKVRIDDILLPLIFTVSIVLVLILAFNSVSPNLN